MKRTGIKDPSRRPVSLGFPTFSSRIKTLSNFLLHQKYKNKEVWMRRFFHSEAKVDKYKRHMEMIVEEGMLRWKVNRIKALEILEGSVPDFTREAIAAYYPSS